MISCGWLRAALVTYEYSITLHDEVNNVWNRKFTVSSVILVLVRWNMLAQVLSEIAPNTPSVCRGESCCKETYKKDLPRFFNRRMFHTSIRVHKQWSPGLPRCNPHYPGSDRQLWHWQGISIILWWEPWMLDYTIDYIEGWDSCAQCAY